MSFRYGRKYVLEEYEEFRFLTIQMSPKEFQIRPDVLFPTLALLGFSVIPKMHADVLAD